MAEPVLTQEIVQSIIDQSFKDNFWYYLLTLAVSVVVTWATAYFTASAKKSAEIRAVTSHLKDLKEQQKELSSSSKAGEIDAISENIRSVMTQLEVTTTTAEQIKNEIEHDHWRRKEIELIKRQKLEELILLMDQVYDSYLGYIQDELFLNDNSYNFSELSKAKVICNLYLSEMVLPYEELNAEYLNFKLWVSNQKCKVLEKQKELFSNGKSIQDPALAAFAIDLLNDDVNKKIQRDFVVKFSNLQFDLFEKGGEIALELNK